MPTLSAISFVAPWMAWGAVAAVGLPLLAHLLSKTRYKEVIFPASRLVKQAIAATSRIETPRHRLLMLLRWLVLMLLVLAFMRPQWAPEASGIDEDHGVALFLLIDASASMRRTADGATLYDRALRNAKGLVDQLDPMRDTAAVIRVDHAPTPLLPEATAQFGLLSERLQASEPGYTHANWPGALAAIERLALNETRSIHVVTLSDQQGTQPDISDLDRRYKGFLNNHERIDAPTDNSSIRLIDIRPYPAIQGQPVTATVEVQHFGDQPLRAPVVADYAGERLQRSVSLNPGATQRVELRLPAIPSEDALLQVTLESPDAIASDNTTGIWLPVVPQTRVLIVHDADHASRYLAERLSTVLDPGELDGQPLPIVEAITTGELEAMLASADPAVLRTVVLLNRSPLTDGESQRVEQYAQAGGGVVQFVEDKGADSTRLTAATGMDFELEPLRIFEGPARAGLSALQWPGVSNKPIDERAKPILMDDLERVIVAEMMRGRGRLIAINTKLSAGPGGLLAEPAFVVLFNELCRYASPGPALPDPPRPGDPIPTSLFEADRLVPSPDAEPRARLFTAPGAYTAMNSDGSVSEIIMAELDPSESDTRVPDRWSDSNEAGDGMDASGSINKTDAATTIRDNPIELWPYLVLGVLGLAACESLLLARFAGPKAQAVHGGDA